VVGVEVARRPRHQLFASIYYLINFHLRKIDRKTELFNDLERQAIQDRNPEAQKNAELYYDHILDIMVSSMRDNYGRDEINYALDMLSVVEDQVIDDSPYEKLVKEKKELESRLREGLKRRAEDELRLQRSKMSFD